MAHFVVASTFSDRQIGGVTTLTRELVHEASRHEWTWIVRRDERAYGATSYADHTGETRRRSGNLDVRAVRSRRGLGLPLRGAGHLAVRRRTDQAALRLMSAAYGPSLARQWPDDAAGVLWSGTGLELLGDAVRRRARAGGVPLQILPALHPGSWGDGPLDARLYRSADRVLALSEDERRRLADLGVADDRVAVLPVGPTVATGGDGARWRSERELAGPIVAFVARRTRAKGLAALVDAHQRLVLDGVPCTLVVAGPPGDAELPEGLPGVVDVGVCTEAEKADLLAACDLFAMPSTAESFGLAYLDAWAYGKPVVTARPPAVLELLAGAEAGWAVDQDPSAIEALLRMLLADPERLRRAGAQGQRRQRERFTWTRSVAVLLEGWPAAAD